MVRAFSPYDGWTGFGKSENVINAGIVIEDGTSWIGYSTEAIS
uniref:Uncharacterized protein n=1 Tax=Populus trichocarpa TaxID=3694 RepID=A0A2K2A940_POPTR